MLQQAFSTTCWGSRQSVRAYGHTTHSVWLLLDPDHTAVHLGGTLAHGQTESEAVYFSRESCVNTRETVQDTFEMFDRDTHTIIAHEHFQRLLRNL